MSSYYGSKPWYYEEFSPPPFELEVRKKIINLEQSRDETLDEYLAYFDSIVASCPHHGFAYSYLLRTFLTGMRLPELCLLDTAAGGSIMELSEKEAWGLIDDLAESTKRGPMHQTEDKAPTMKVDSVQNEPGITPIASLPAANPEGDISIRAVMDVEAALKEPTLEPTKLTEDEDAWITEEEPTWDLTPEPSEVMDESDTESIEEESSWELTAKADEEIKPGPVLIFNLSKKDLALVVEVPQFVPSVCMRISAPEDEVINDEVQGELEPEKPTMKHSLATSQPSSPENSLVLGWPIISATKKRQRHGPVQWKPGRRNKSARLDEPANMVKESSPSRGYVKKKPPDQGRAKLSPLPYVFFGQIKRAAVKKFDLKQPWDPNTSARKKSGKGPEQNDSYMEHAFAMTGQGSPKQEKTQFKKLIVKGPSPSQRRWKEIPSELDPNPSSAKKSGRLTARIKVGGIKKYDLSHPWDPNQ